jgi:uncharacterized Ntn-hydrolase superfamily protein
VQLEPIFEEEKSMRTACIVAAVVLLALGVPARGRTSARTLGTFSIVARDPLTDEVGAAVQSKYFNVGHAVPWVEGGVGAVCTQASVNPSLGPRALALMKAGFSGPEALDALMEQDEGRDQRQLGLVDAAGKAASWTGESCLDWAGQRTGPDYAVQGNILAGEAVVVAMQKAFLETEGELAHRLVAALEAAQAAGGDKRGQQSAALVVGRPSQRHPEFRTRYVDLRVDDHAQPIKELRRLYGIYEANVLAQAHVKLLAEADAAGDERLVALGRKRIGAILRRASDNPELGASALNGLAWNVASQGMYLEEALRAARRAAELEPESWEILDTLAEVLFRLGQREEALEVGERALLLAPGQDYLRQQLRRFKQDLIPERTD